VETAPGDPGTEIIHAPPRARLVRQLALTVVATAAAAAVMAFAVLPWIRGYLKGAGENLPERAMHVFLALALCVAASGVGTIAYGILAWRGGRWPVTGAFVLRDTPLLRGRAARLRAILMILFGLGQIAVAAYVAMVPRLLFASGT